MKLDIGLTQILTEITKQYSIEEMVTCVEALSEGLEGQDQATFYDKAYKLFAWKTDRLGYDDINEILESRIARNEKENLKCRCLH